MEPTETERWSQQGLGDNRQDRLRRVGRAKDGAHMSPVSVECHREGATGVVVVSGELALEGGDVVEIAVADLLRDGVANVTIDGGGLTFIDSSGLAGLIAARTLVKDAGGMFHFGPTTDQVARTIAIAGVHDILGPEAT